MKVLEELENSISTTAPAKAVQEDPKRQTISTSARKSKPASEKAETPKPKENEPKKEKLVIDKKKMIIYSEIMKPKYDG